ncbi:MAG: hypothetical protein OXG58_09740 [Gemmatimonadetes bacterium]|nr:hypothetical protein [Gemmatimonadota bacterium]
MRRRPPLPTLALALAAGACSETHDDASATDRPLTAEFVEVFRVGASELPDWAQFGTPPSVAFDGGGNLFVLNPDVPVVAVLDRDGELVRTLGRRGEGPGEFSGPDDIYVWRDGTAAVADRGSGIYVVFAPDGSFDRQVNMSAGQVGRYGMMAFRSGARPHPDAGVLVARGMGSHVQEMFRQMEMANPTIGPRGLERLTLGAMGTTAEPIVKAGEVRAQVPGDEESTGTDDPRRFDPGLLFDVLPDGSVAYCDSAHYSIKLVAGDGAPVATIARPITPEPVTAEIETAVRDSAMAEFERLYGDPANPQGPDRAPPEFMAAMVAELRENIEGMRFNHEIPVVLSLEATWEGGLWVRHRREGDPWTGAVGVIDVWSPDGRYVGTLPPEGLRMPDAFGPDGLMAYIELDEMEVPTVRVVRLVGLEPQG